MRALVISQKSFAMRIAIYIVAASFFPAATINSLTA
jgi:hypothetical protein